ncbi:hypothetical protein BDFB_015052 [Asbolus verrucosus]|uniref:Uncharacterized protein n=1 Tax=Asbolus verrucosus TaxID=1661398 RepID=A0A482WA46_ASBVE|nr:hypothetical protein BDFB_015052 [Asbolus verrucosus]
MPLNPGLHKLDVSLSKPQASSLLGYIGSFFGYQPELLQPKIYGEIRICVSVVMQGLRNLGYDLGRAKN